MLTGGGVAGCACRQLAVHRFSCCCRGLKAFGGAAGPQKAALRSLIAQSTFDPTRSLRRTPAPANDLAQVLRQIASGPSNTGAQPQPAAWLHGAFQHLTRPGLPALRPRTGGEGALASPWRCTVR